MTFIISTATMILFLRLSSLLLLLVTSVIVPSTTCAFVFPTVRKLRRPPWQNDIIVDSSIRSQFHTRRPDNDEEEVNYPTSPIHRSVGVGSRIISAMYASAVSFSSPLLEAGYPPAVAELSSSSVSGSVKPLLLYLPGFDGTLVAPFPELGTEFDVRGMTVAMDNQSTLL